MTLNHALGQYFTTNIMLKTKVQSFILNDPETILEPSIGRGDLVSFLTTSSPNLTFDMCEIDPQITLLPTIAKHAVHYGDFLTQVITKKYKTIVGNPPYVRTKKGNLYLDFIQKCYGLLEPDGELVFIVPSDLFKLTSSAKLLDQMLTTGTFTHIFHPHDETLFENASIDVLVFRYCKNPTLAKIVQYNDQPHYLTNSGGMVTFSPNQPDNTIMIKDFFDVYVGMVSGKEKVYKNDQLGNIKILTGENKFENYIYIDVYPCEHEAINEYLLQHKPELIDRAIRGFNQDNWFEWGAPRNIKTMRKYKGQACIYIYNLTRKSDVAFLGQVDYFGGNLLMLKPKKLCNLVKILAYLNSRDFKDNFTFSGRFKLGHRQIANSYLPSHCF